MDHATARPACALESPMARLYERLRKANLDPKYVSRVAFPEWWNDDLARVPSGYARALGFIARHIGLDLRALWDESAPLTCPDFGKTNFKKSREVTESDVEWPKCIALSAARVALQAIDCEPKPLPATGAQIRAEIMERGNSCVDLANLLNYLWEHGVPVLHVSNLPAKKMAGLTAKIYDHPVIVLSKNHAFSALMVFDLAHELGHILCGHLETASVVLDSTIDRLETADLEEASANATAIEVLTGKPNLQYRYNQRYVTSRELAELAIATGKKRGVDPGVVAQNFAHGRGIHALANGACKLTEPKAKPISLVHQKMIEHLALEELPPEDAEFLLRVTGAELPHGAPV
jgi:hypothetical protein